jgi:hypothetical protein
LGDLRLAASTLGLSLEKIAGDALANYRDKNTDERAKRRYLLEKL